MSYVLPDKPLEASPILVRWLTGPRKEQTCSERVSRTSRSRERPTYMNGQWKEFKGLVLIVNTCGEGFTLYHI